MKVLVVVLSVVAVASAGYLANHGLLTDGLLARGIVAPGLLGRGLVDPGLIGSGLVAPGLIGSGLVAPGLVRSGLVAPGLIGSGLVAPGLVAAPGVRLIPGGPANIVIGPGGVPLDTPEVAAAKGAHAVAVAQTRARDTIINPVGLGLVAAPGVIGAPGVVASSVYDARALVAPGVLGGHYGGVLGVHHGVVLGPGGVPLDTPEVAAAKVANAAAHLEAKARVGLIH